MFWAILKAIGTVPEVFDKPQCEGPKENEKVSKHPAVDLLTLQRWSVQRLLF